MAKAAFILLFGVANSAPVPIEQISLALTANPGEMSATWVKMEPYKTTFSGSVTWWPIASPTKRSVVGSVHAPWSQV